MSYTPKIRLFVESALSSGCVLELQQTQTHYLKNVMRLQPSDKIIVFNGQDGEWQAVLSEIGKKSSSVVVEKQLRPQKEEPDIWLIFALVKRDATDAIIRKSTELGVAQILPVFTERTDVKGYNRERMHKIAIEAAEQCERLTCPVTNEAVELHELLESWDKERKIIICDESGSGEPIGKALTKQQKAKWALLIGPEGGFSDSELAMLRKLPYVLPVGLGPRILRADTAASAALACWQEHLGDWDNNRA